MSSRIISPLYPARTSLRPLGKNSQERLNAVNRQLILCSTVLILATLTGCSSSRSLVGSPGTIQQQQYGASLHDPYTDNQAGPAVVGRTSPRFSESTRRACPEPLVAGQLVVAVNRCEVDYGRYISSKYRFGRRLQFQFAQRRRQKRRLSRGERFSGGIPG